MVTGQQYKRDSFAITYSKIIMSFFKRKKKKTHKNQTYKIKILQAWESQTSISNRLKVIKMVAWFKAF